MWLIILYFFLIFFILPVEFFEEVIDKHIVFNYNFTLLPLRIEEIVSDGILACRSPILAVREWNVRGCFLRPQNNGEPGP